MSARVLPVVTGETYPDDVVRPKTRGECLAGPRPCPFVSCRHHLFIDSLTVKGEPRSRFEDLEQLAETCSLDVADAGARPARTVGRVMGLSHGRVQQLEYDGCESLKKLLPADMLQAWTHTTEVIADAGAGDVVDPEFKAQVSAAYDRIVPKKDHGALVSRHPPKPGSDP